MPVDTSIYGNQPQPTNPLTLLSGAASLRNTLNQNQLFQQQYQTNLGLGQIYKNAVGPDGIVDFSKIPGLIQQNPNVTMALPQAMQNSQEAQQRQQALTQQQLATHQQELQTASSYLTPLLRLPNPTSKDVATAMSQALTIGHTDMDTLGTIWADMPRKDPNNPQSPIDESQIKTWLQQKQFQLLSQQQQFDAMNPAPAPINTGAQTQLIRTPQIGAPSVAGVLNNTVAPGTVMYPQGGGQPTYSGVGGGGTGGPGGGGFAANPPGFETAANTAAGGSAGAYQSLRNDVAGSATRVFQLSKALQGIQGANTGPGSDALNNAKSLLLTLAPKVLTSLGIPDPNKIKNYDEANKYLTAYAINQAGSLGEGTDSKLASAITANASTHISNLAAQDVIKANIALEKMKQAQAASFKASGKGPADYSDWADQWNSRADARAFLMDQMGPGQRAAMISKMKPAEKQAFLDTFKAGVGTGIINPSDIPQQ